jgi:hypothetical protein
MNDATRYSSAYHVGNVLVFLAILADLLKSWTLLFSSGNSSLFKQSNEASI